MTRQEIIDALYNARCLCGLNRNQHASAQAYYLVLATGLPTDINQVIQLSACQQCYLRSQQDVILAWIISAETGATGTPEQIINSSPCVYCVPPGYLDGFKTYMLWTIAVENNPTETPPTPIQGPPPSWVSTPAVVVDGISNYITRTQPPTRFNPAACAVVLLITGGGDKFDCYSLSRPNEVFMGLPDAGTNFTGLWLYGDNPFGSPYGDTFQSYTVGPAINLTDGTGFTGGWILGSL